MIYNKKSGIFVSDILNHEVGVVHGYSGKIHGDMRRSSLNRKKFISYLGLSKACLLMTDQIHGSSVYIIKKNTPEGFVPRTDALVCRPIEHKAVCLGAFGADCLVLLFLDCEFKTIAIAHAGWRGTLAGISKEVVKTMVSLGSNAKNIRVSIGPHIRSCCYSVPQNRSKYFKNFYFGKKKGVIRRNNSWYVDLGLANLHELLQEGVQKENIDMSFFCTMCQKDKVFSYRGSTTRPVGEMMGVIAYKSG